MDVATSPPVSQDASAVVHTDRAPFVDQRSHFDFDFVPGEGSIAADLHAVEKYKCSHSVTIDDQTFGTADGGIVHCCLMQVRT